MTSKVQISIIIPTRNRPAELSNCLESLAVQETRTEFEVLVIDDHSDTVVWDHYDKLLRQHDWLNLQFLRLDANSRGAAAARNLAYECSSGEIIALLDDDAIPDSKWLQTIINIFELHKDIDAITGWIDPIDTRHPLSIFRQVFYEQRYKRLLSRESTEAIQQSYGIRWQNPNIFLTDNLSGANSAFRRSVVNCPQLFDTKFAMMHDKEFTISLLKRQKVCVFIPELRIKHKHTKSLRDALIKSFRSGKYRALLEQKHPDTLQSHRILDLGAPLKKLEVALNHEGELQIKPTAFIIFAFLFEYLHQARYLSAIIYQRVFQVQNKENQ